MPRLIVNADDYGLTPGVNRGIQDVFAAGALTSATVMAAAEHASSAVTYCQAHPRLGVGCHLVLVDGAPVAPSGEVASLLKPGTQLFYPTLGEFLRALFAGRIRTHDVRREAAAQLQLLCSMGIQPTHVDTHKHTHMFPAILDSVLSAAADAGIRAVRNPMEPAWAVSLTKGSSKVRRLEVTTLRTLYQQRFLQTVRQHGFRTTDGALGVTATGTLDEKTLRSLVSQLPEGTWELVCHPGFQDADLAKIHTRLRKSREVEAQCLQSIPSLLAADTELVSFAALTPGEPAS
jgi:predicted glycoside hydrolase/deacetylase ChbG (UPF0249 family)